MGFRSFFLFIFFFSHQILAQSPSFESISDDDLDKIVREFSANFVHTSATPPTSLGKVFGVEAALIAGLTQSPGIQEISRSADPSSEIEYLPHAWLLAGFSAPYGMSVEINILPKLEMQEVDMSHASIGLKWSITDQFFKNLPFDLAVRTYYTRSRFSFQQSVSNPTFPGTSTVEVTYENTMIGGDTLLGFDLGLIEPYFGMGFVNTEGDLAGYSTTNTPFSVFDDESSGSKASSQGSARLIAGASLHLAALNIGLEYSRVFSTNRLSAKLGLQF